jgi:TldD protein
LAKTAARPKVARIVVRPNKYDKGRANLALFNFANKSALDVDPGALPALLGPNRGELARLMPEVRPRPDRPGSEAVGATGGWDCLFARASPEALADKAAAQAVDLLSAGYPEGGRVRVLLSPALVGLLTHEAVGHTVEADFVQAGSVAAGKLGQRVASERITLLDSGASELQPGAGGTLAVDDEGVLAGKTTIIREGVLTSYLHDRESAARFHVAPTGNARAWEYEHAPLIRMRNTYIAPGDASLAEMIALLGDGYLLDGASNGQADSNGEFMFGTREAYRITRGERGPLLRGVNISGQAFDVLRSVEAVGREFHWDLGSGHCGKGQPAKVDAGGPWLLCTVVLGGR